MNDIILLFSDEIAPRWLLFLFDHGFHLLLEDYPHGFVEDRFESFLSEGAALHVLAFELLLYDFSGSFFHDWGFFGVFFHHSILISQIYLVSHKNLRHVAHIFLQLGVPLYYKEFTFLRALTKEEGSMTEKMTRKTSQFG